MPPVPVLTWTALEDTLAQMQSKSDDTRALALQPDCHPRATVEVVYLGGETVSLRCHRCQAVFVHLALARG